MYLNVYVPLLQRALGVVAFFRHHRGAPLASSALMEPISRAFVAALERYARTQGVLLSPSPRDNQGTTQGRGGRRPLGPVSGARGRAVHRQGAGESHRLPHREAAQSADRPAVPLDSQRMESLLLEPKEWSPCYWNRRKQLNSARVGTDQARAPSYPIGWGFCFVCGAEGMLRVELRKHSVRFLVGAAGGQSLIVTYPTWVEYQ
jgi:hypothetical protein